MNFLLNIVVAAVSLTVLAVLALIILGVALVIWLVFNAEKKGLAEMPKPTYPPAEEVDDSAIRTDVVRIVKLIQAATNEKKLWEAKSEIEKFHTEHSGHPDLYREEAALRYILTERIADVHSGGGIFNTAR